MKISFLFFALLLALFASRSVCACDLTIHTQQQMPDGRINAIGLNVSHGFISSLRQNIIGWRFVVMNDPSWLTWATGQSIVSSTDLEPNELSSIFAITPEPGMSCTDLVKNGDVSVSLTLERYNDDKLRKYRVARSALELRD